MELLHLYNPQKKVEVLFFQYLYLAFIKTFRVSGPKTKGFLLYYRFLVWYRRVVAHRTLVRLSLLGRRSLL